MHVSTHLIFRGQCEAAFTFYERTLGGTILTMLAYGDSPLAQQVSPEWRRKIVHATLTVGGRALTGADVLPAEYAPPQGFYVLLGVDGRREAERIFHAMAVGGAVKLPIQKTFWSPCFGVLIDAFGIPWEINAEGEA